MNACPHCRAQRWKRCCRSAPIERCFWFICRTCGLIFDPKSGKWARQDLAVK